MREQLHHEINTQRQDYENKIHLLTDKLDKMNHLFKEHIVDHEGYKRQISLRDVEISEWRTRKPLLDSL